MHVFVQPDPRSKGGADKVRANKPITPTELDQMWHNSKGRSEDEVRLPDPMAARHVR